MPIVYLHNDTHCDELADLLSLFEQLIGTWIHINIRYFKISQHCTGISTCILIFLWPTTSHWFQFSQHASMPYHIMACHLSPLKNIFENSSCMLHHLGPCHIFLLKNLENHLMPHHLSLLKNNSKNSRSMLHHLMPCHISPLNNNSKTSRKIYYNSLRVINGEFSQHASMPRQLSPLKNNSKNFRNIYFSKLVPQL
jgi:hypothetical protein